MKIITEPRVRVFSTQVFHPDSDFPIPDDGDDYTKIGAFAAKTCYASFGTDGRSNEGNQDKIIESGHGRILEHMVVGLYISGISRALGNELITHKAGIVVSQRSTRYTDEGEGGFVLEPFLADRYKKSNSDALAVTQLAHAHNDFFIYERIVKKLISDGANPGTTPTERRKWARGKARNSLPLGLETAMVVTGNLRAWRHFIEMRSERYAEAEIRRLTMHIFYNLSRVAPFYFGDYEVGEYDGFPEYTTPNRKV